MSVVLIYYVFQSVILLRNKQIMKPVRNKPEVDVSVDSIAA